MNTPHPANDADHEDPADVLISDAAIDDLAEKIIAMEDANEAVMRLVDEVLRVVA